jgi:hypothetical protein
MENLDAIKIRRITDVEEIEKVCSGRDIICDFCNFEEVNSQRTMDDVNEKWRLDTHIDPSNTASIESGSRRHASLMKTERPSLKDSLSRLLFLLLLRSIPSRMTSTASLSLLMTLTILLRKYQENRFLPIREYQKEVILRCSLWKIR